MKHLDLGVTMKCFARFEYFIHLSHGQWEACHARHVQDCSSMFNLPLQLGLAGDTCGSLLLFCVFWDLRSERLQLPQLVLQKWCDGHQARPGEIEIGCDVIDGTVKEDGCGRLW